MKKIVLGAVALSLSIISWSALAEEQPLLEDQCKAMGVQHGMEGEKLDEWMVRCMKMTKTIHEKKAQRGAHHEGGKHEGEKDEPRH